MVNRPDIVYALLKHRANMDHYDIFLKNAIRYAKEGSECMKIIQGCYDDRHSKVRVFQYRPQYQLALIEAVHVDTQTDSPRASTPVNKKTDKEANKPFNINSKMDDPEYCKHITNLFLASSLKTQQQ